MIETTELQIELSHNLLESLSLNKKQMLEMEREIGEAYDENNYKSFELVYYGEPKPQARHRSSSSNGGFMYDPSRGLKKWVVEQIMTKLPKDFVPIEKSIMIRMDFFRQTPMGFSKKDKVLAELGIKPNSGRPDVDNYIKLVQDALNKIMYKDDSMIVDIHGRKFYSCKPRVELFVKYRI